MGINTPGDPPLGPEKFWTALRKDGGALGGGEFAPFSGREIAGGEIADAGAQEAEGGVADGGGHAADLVVHI